MAIFRASEVTLRGGDTVSDIVHRIISKHTTDQEETASKPVVQDITDLFATKTRIKTTGRGTALIMFPGPVPEPFQHVMRGKTAKLLADTTGRSTISMEVDAKFIGMTQLHGLPPDVKHMAEYVPMSCSVLNASKAEKANSENTASLPSMVSTAIHTGAGSASRTARRCG